MISFKTALTRIFESVKELPAQTISVDDSLGFVTAEDIVSPINLPPFDNSAMDGFAVNSSECLSSKFEVSQIIKAGDVPSPLKLWTCAKIMTGAAIPQGTDAVVPIEEVEIRNDEVFILKSPVTGQHIRRIGEDVKAHTIILKKGTILTPRAVALLAAVGLNEVMVYDRPKIIIITTGSELIQPGEPLPPSKIYDSNGAALLAAIKELGIGARAISIKDDEASIEATLEDALNNYDVIITVGGVSVGDYDYVKAALKKLGVEEVFHKVAIKPGKPLYFGTHSGCRYIFGLPGNPVSALITFDRFVRPAILKMMGHKQIYKERFSAVAVETLKGSHGKVDFLRGICRKEGGRFLVRSAGSQGSAMLKALAEANCIIVVPEDKDKIEAGSPAEVELC
ncbi:MAG: hypothetical protein A3I09_01385 [Deltaproteobacteria bacterium RIFCSPLOWO2_02_FULL_47_10]|nr:MAG: hypothetical protein A3I09_01385 [Deltaproteobacteria bacterium RIFCSPLOWO2_02_FULL_47_10]